MFHLRFGLSDHLKALLDFVFGSRRRVKKVRIFRAWFSHFCLVVGVGFVFGLCFLALVVLVLLCLGFRLCTICSVIHKL